jgi:GAF domain-containing protein
MAPATKLDHSSRRRGRTVAPARPVRLEPATLYEIIGLVASSPELDPVLDGIVGLVTEATGCHACFIYVRHGEELRLTAATRGFAHLVGRVVVGTDEGLTGWAVRTGTPAFIRDDALNDPRFKYIAEIEDQRFQSIVAVPIPARSGDIVGAVVLLSQTPREFDDHVLTFIEHTAALVAGAIETGRLFDEARRRVDAFGGLTALSQRIAAVTAREDLYRAVTEGVRSLLGCRVSALEVMGADGRPVLAAADPPEAGPSWHGSGASVFAPPAFPRNRGGLRTADDRPRTTLVAAIMAADEELGLLTVCADREFSRDEGEMLHAVASQVAVALKRTELIERLTTEDLGRQVMDSLAAGDVDVARARARSVGIDLDRPYVVVEARRRRSDMRPWPAVASAVESALRRVSQSATIDVGTQALRAIVPAAGRHGGLPVQDALRECAAAERVHVGMAYASGGLERPGAGLTQATDACTVATALLPAGGVLAYDDLGAYKYLVRVADADVPDERHAVAIARIADYDRRRHAELLHTLEQYFDHGRAPAGTARALYIHPNTLRQRLERIETLTGLCLAKENALSLELAIKLARLRGEVG